MSIQIEALFTSAGDLQSPWAVADVKLDTAKHRIDFGVACKATTLACPSFCGAKAPVGQSARILRVKDKQLWRRIEHCVAEGRHGLLAPGGDQL